MGKANINRRASKKGKSKDPRLPKKPLSSFMEFCRDERKRILGGGEVHSVAEIGKKLGKRWRDLDANAKQLYKMRGDKNRSEYEKEKERLLSCDPGASSVVQSEELEEVEESDEQAVNVHKEKVKIDDLGFAKQNKFQWHPALRTGTLANGTRVRVTFFGTGQSGTVN